jgi:hypothetical protein
MRNAMTFSIEQGSNESLCDLRGIKGYGKPRHLLSVRMIAIGKLIQTAKENLDSFSSFFKIVVGLNQFWGEANARQAPAVKASGIRHQWFAG